MHAIILAAGLGTRLAPLTDRLPKALVPVAGAPAIDHVMTRLRRAGVGVVGVNAHHHAALLTRFLDRREGEPRAHCIVEETIQGPAGGIAGFVPWLRRRVRGEPVLLHNADAVTDLDLGSLLAAHRARSEELRAGRLAMTMALVSHRPTDSVRVDRSGNVLGFGAAGEAGSWTYSGVAVLDWPWLDRLEPGRPAPFVPSVTAAIDAGLVVRGWRAEGAAWHDLGTPERYLAAHGAIAGGALSEWGGGLPVAAGNASWRIAPSARVAASARLSGWGVAGRECEIGEGARLSDTVMFDGASVGAGEVLEGAIVAPWARVARGGGAGAGDE
ncbi:MAG: hypothetical protein CME06_09620 [Gemmatimonadetes bacterium]|nr:hypothetical protein [Gemmatimonadota bacterium]